MWYHSKNPSKDISLGLNCSKDKQIHQKQKKLEKNKTINSNWSAMEPFKNELPKI